jgi:23S rRNA (guanosine2251-2'-O)-methyltransferase
MTSFIYGIHATLSFLQQAEAEPGRLLLKTGSLGPRLREIRQLAEKTNCAIEFADRARMDEITPGHQGVILYAGSAPGKQASLDDVLQLSSGKRLVLVLDGVTDPGNLGACMRSAATMGVNAVIAPQNNSAPLGSVAIKTASGGADLVPYLQVANVARSLEQLKAAGFWIVGTAPEAAQSIQQCDLTGDLVIVMGSEEKGMRRITREHCDYLVTIPMVNTTLGFNVSVATGITLYEVQRQRMP